MAIEMECLCVNEKKYIGLFSVVSISEKANLSTDICCCISLQDFCIAAAVGDKRPCMK